MSQSLPEDFPIDPTTTSGSKLAEILNRQNDAFLTNSSGATAPTDTQPGMFWLDTSGATPIMRIRNAANNGWIQLFNTVFDQTASLAQLGLPNHQLMQVSPAGALTLGVAGQPGQVLLNKTTTSVGNFVNSLLNGKPLWQFVMGGGDAQGNFGINAFDDTGAFKGSPLTIDRSTQRVSVLTQNTGDRSAGVATTQFIGNEFAFSAAGWQRFAGGVVLQWGDTLVVTNSGGDQVINFPLAYPTGVLAIAAWNADSATGNMGVQELRQGGWPSKTGWAVHCLNMATGAAMPAVNCRVGWMSVGY